MLHSMLDFQENEGDNRKLNKVKELVQQFREHCNHHVLKRNIIKGRRNTVVCKNMKQTSIDCGVALCGVSGNAGENAIYAKKIYG